MKEVVLYIMEANFLNIITVFQTNEYNNINQ